jgi:hypothetical protein
MTVIRFGTGRQGTKFGNHKTIRGGQVFDSKREANRFDALKLLEANGEVRNIRRQVKYVMIVNGVRITTWKADFVYDELRKGTWTEVVEDSKGYPNDRWPMKKKLMKACHGITVRES